MIAIYWMEHGVPHSHAKYGHHRASFFIGNLCLLEGRLLPRVTALVLEWPFLRRDELLENWRLAVDRKPLKRIKPWA